jgi:hypothetical protein
MPFVGRKIPDVGDRGRRVTGRNKRGSSGGKELICFDLKIRFFIHMNQNYY